MKRRPSIAELRRELSHALLQARVTSLRARGTARSASARLRGAARGAAAYVAAVAAAVAAYATGRVRAGLAARTALVRAGLIVVLAVVATATVAFLVTWPGGESDPAQPPGGQLPTATASSGPRAELEPAPLPVAPQPCPPPVERTHWVTSGETLTQIALRYHTGLEQLAADNHIANRNVIAAGTQLKIRPLCQGTTVIQPGTTLSGYAAQYSTSVAALAALNPHIPNPHRIYAGGALRLRPQQPS